MKIFTVGYGGRTKEELLAHLNSNGIKTVVDIRLRPDKASMGIWVKAKTADKGIEKWLGDSGIAYRSLIELGNVFLDFPDWRDRYLRLLESAGDMLTDRLDSVPGPICLLCAEKRFEDCHRQQVGDYLSRKGKEVQHL